MGTVFRAHGPTPTIRQPVAARVARGGMTRAQSAANRTAQPQPAQRRPSFGSLADRFVMEQDTMNPNRKTFSWEWIHLPQSNVT